MDSALTLSLGELSNNSAIALSAGVSNVLSYSECVLASVIGTLVPRWNFFFPSSAAFLVKRATLTLYHMMVEGLEFGMTVLKSESFYKRGILTLPQKNSYIIFAFILLNIS